MSKDLFFEMRAEEMSRMYDPSFSKKEAQDVGKKIINTVLENGEIDIYEYGANLARLSEVVASALKSFREHIKISDKQKVMGVEFIPVDGGYSINYEEDIIYCQLKSEIDLRIELLKLAQTQNIFDAYGNEVPKVSKTARKSSVTIKF